MCVCVSVYLSVAPARPCCGGDRCVFPACRGGRVGERRAGVVAEASAGPECGGSEGCGLPDGTLEETPHWSCINCLLWLNRIFLFALYRFFNNMEEGVYLKTAGQWSECSAGQFWFWEGESLVLLTPLTCLNQTHTHFTQCSTSHTARSPLLFSDPQLLYPH